MKFLSITTSSNICSISLFKENTPIDTLEVDNEKTHSEKFLPLLKHLMDENNVCFRDLTYIAIDVGPGSFTGIRIGIASIKAIAEVHNLKIIGVTSLKALSYNSLKENTNVIY